jgi:hypothetical protein
MVKIDSNHPSINDLVVSFQGQDARPVSAQKMRFDIKNMLIALRIMNFPL